MVKMGCTALLFTAVLFCEIFACVVNQSGKMALILIPLLLMPLPMVLLRLCGGGGDFMSDAPKGKHCMCPMYPRRVCMCPEETLVSEQCLP